MSAQPPRPRGRGGQKRHHSTMDSAVSNGHNSGAQTSTTAAQAAPATVAPTPTVSTHLSDVRFDSLKDQVDSRLLSAIPFPLMSEVQAATLGPALTGSDVLAQAKTGTGKTIAFLLPTLNRILKSQSRGSSARAGSVSCLIMSPTRELALQIQKEAEMLLKNVAGSVGVQHVVGGTNMKSEERNLATKRCDVLVATPGRLLDHLTNTAGMADKFAALQVYVLDEADRMLDMGFRQELAKIARFLPDRRKVPRQALLFSATIPPGIREVADLDANAQFINTLSEEEANTHAHVPQQHVIASSVTEIFPLTLALVLEELQRAPQTAKIIVFSPTARAAGLAAEVFRSTAIGRVLKAAVGDNGPFTIGEVHSRRSQSQRVKATQEFAQTPRGVLFSSDVAARGVDFPGVSAVFQVGLPASPEQYIHRIGRTGRAGAQGRGVIVLTSYESYFLNRGEMRDLPIAPHPGLPQALIDASGAAVTQAMVSEVSDESKAQAYSASLGYYKSELKNLRWSVADLVQNMNEYAARALLYAGGKGNLPPPLLAKTVGKMGLKGTPGLNIVRELPERTGGGAQGGNPRQGGGQPRHNGGHAENGGLAGGEGHSVQSNGAFGGRGGRGGNPGAGAGGRGRGGFGGRGGRGGRGRGGASAGAGP
ncbi:hypothetical protein IAU60_005374 [Kwoniella sp. DSM 27419]